MRRFHTYLYGQDVLLRTDNSADSFAQKLKNPSGQIARWLQEFATYNLTVVHRPGTQHRNADALSRKPFAACERMNRYEEEWEMKNEERVNSVQVVSETIMKNEVLLSYAVQTRGSESGSEPQPCTSKDPDVPNFKRNISPVLLEDWDSDKLREAQMQDLSIGPIFRALEHT